MKSFVRLLFLLAAALVVGCSPRPFTARLMCYNVHNCVGLDDSLSCERIARIINNADVEAVALQELDSMTARYPGHDMLSEVAALTSMHPTYAASIDYRGGKYGIGILTREKPLSFRRVPLPCSSEPRSLLIVELEDYYYCCTHLSLHEVDRIESVRIITRELAQLDKPALIAGDFNAQPNSLPMMAMQRQFDIFAKQGSPFTFPADRPDREIDYICLYKGAGDVAEVVSHTVVNAPVESDHAPIVVEVVVTPHK